MLSTALPTAASFLIIVLSLLHTSGAQTSANCPLLTLADLGTNETLSDVGLVSASTGNLVQILDFNIECLVSGEFRDTYSSAGVVVLYQCGDPNGGECVDTAGVIETQLVFPCTNGTWQPAELTLDNSFPGEVLRDNPLLTNCFRCELFPEEGISCICKFVQYLCLNKIGMDYAH